VDDIYSNINGLSIPIRLAVFAGIAIATHLVVILVRQSAGVALSSASGRRYQKLRSIGTLATSATVFTLYFLTLGLILREFGVSLTNEQRVRYILFVSDSCPKVLSFSDART